MKFTNVKLSVPVTENSTENWELPGGAFSYFPTPLPKDPAIVEVVNLPLKGALPSDPYTVKEIVGLGPPEINVFISNTQNQGGVYQGRRPLNRQLVITLGLNINHAGGQTPEMLRTELYSLLTKQNGKVVFSLMDGATEKARTDGYISKFETAMFQQKPAVQITIDCDQPYFEAPEPVMLSPASGLAANIPAVVNNPGNAPTPFRMKYRVKNNSTRAGVTLNGAVPFSSTVTGGFVVNDEPHFSTIPGSRFFYYAKLGASNYVNLLANILGDWPVLQGGQNTVAPHNSTTQYEWIYIVYTPRYWGV